MTKYKPMGDRVLIEVKQVEKTASGIIMPDSSSESIKTGTVIAVGGGVYTNDGVKVPMETYIGDTVMFQSGMGVQKIKLDGTDYFMCRESELLLIVIKSVETD